MANVEKRNSEIIEGEEEEVNYEFYESDNAQPSDVSQAEDEIPQYIRKIAEGKKETIDFEVSLSSKPQWLDEKKFKRGQKFANNYLYGVIYCEMLSLFMLFAIKPIVKTLIFTRMSTTPYKAFKRYFGTAQKIISWYKTDVWSRSQGRSNISIVRGLHKNVFNKLQETLPDRTSLGDPETTALWSTSADILVKDFQEFCATHPGFSYLFQDSNSVWLSQRDMAITQFGFVGLVIAYPKYFGIYNFSSGDLEDFIHMWRGLGYLLGIKDEFNFCDGDLPTVRQRTNDMITCVVKPALREIDHEWEHMSRCLVGGFGLYASSQNFEASVLYLCHVLKIKTPRFKKTLSYKSVWPFYQRRFFYSLAKLPFLRNYYNGYFREEIKEVEQTPARVYAKWEATTFDYMNQPGKSPVHSDT